MRKLAVAGSFALALGVSALGPSAHAEEAEYRVGPVFERVFSEHAVESGPVPRASVPSPYEAVDPEDAPGRADILGYRVKHDRQIVLDLELRTPVDLVNNRHWREGTSYIAWDINTDGDDAIEYFALLFNDHAGGLMAVVDNNLKLPPKCGANFSHPENDVYRLRFSRSCINKPDTIRVIAGTFFDNKPFSTEARPYGPEDFGDLAPDPSPGPVYNYTPEVAFG